MKRTGKIQKVQSPIIPVTCTATYDQFMRHICGSTPCGSGKRSPHGLDTAQTPLNDRQYQPRTEQNKEGIIAVLATMTQIFLGSLVLTMPALSWTAYAR